jgi:hypothetical protein
LYENLQQLSLFRNPISDTAAAVITGDLQLLSSDGAAGPGAIVNALKLNSVLSGLISATTKLEILAPLQFGSAKSKH